MKSTDIENGTINRLWVVGGTTCGQVDGATLGSERLDGSTDHQVVLTHALVSVATGSHTCSLCGEIDVDGKALRANLLATTVAGDVNG